METRYGMNDTIGARTYAPPPQPFLAGTIANRIEASEATEREIDIAVRDIVAKAFERATEVLRTRRPNLDDGVRLLLAQETVTADQFPARQSDRLLQLRLHPRRFEPKRGWSKDHGQAWIGQERTCRECRT
jgi:cell division protease FtsH